MPPPAHPTPEDQPDKKTAEKNKKQKRGRRPGFPDTKNTIMISARSTFAELGYEKTSVRSIADLSGVDPSLVLYFFGSKENLFHEAVVQALQFMVPPHSVFADGPHHIAERLLQHVMSLWEAPSSRDTLTAILRSSMSHHMAACELSAFFEGHLLPQFRDTIQMPNPELRSCLVSSHLAGLTLMRYVVPVKPLASMEVPQIISSVAPTLRHYILGEL